MFTEVMRLKIMQLLNVLCKLAHHYYTIIIYDGHVVQSLLPDRPAIP